METLRGFLNEHGGQVLFGVANDGRILGQQITDSTLQDVANTLGRLEPAAPVNQQRLAIGKDLDV